VTRRVARDEERGLGECWCWSCSWWWAALGGVQRGATTCAAFLRQAAGRASRAASVVPGEGDRAACRCCWQKRAQEGWEERRLCDDVRLCGRAARGCSRRARARVKDGRGGPQPSRSRGRCRWRWWWWWWYWRCCCWPVSASAWLRLLSCARSSLAGAQDPSDGPARKLSGMPTSCGGGSVSRPLASLKGGRNALAALSGRQAGRLVCSSAALAPTARRRLKFGVSTHGESCARPPLSFAAVRA
jgi:hypothetical protein